MELVAEKYKQTEVGLIPSDWEVHSLNDEISALDAGISVNSLNERFDVEHDFAILKTSCVSSGSFIPIEAKKIVTSEIQRAKLNPKKNRIIISRMNTPDLVGECGYVSKDYPNLFLPDRLWMMSFKKSSFINARWLNYILNYSVFRQKIRELGTGTSGSMKNISKSKLLEILIPYPNEREQTAIATSLSDADALISSLEKLIAKKKAIKQGAMQQLLTPPHKGGKRSAGFTGEWVEKKLGEVGEIITGSTPPTEIKEYWNGNIPWITPTDISDKKNIYNSEREISNKGLQVIRKLPGNSLLVTCIASIGKNAILRTQGACNQQINAIVPNEENDVDFLYYLIEKSKSVLIGNAGITATLMISKRDFSLLSFFVPKLKEQNAISKILSDMDLEIEALESKLFKSKSIKQGMMQELLTGKTRLI